MKKFLAIILAVVLMLSLSVVAFADTLPAGTENGTWTITKVYKLEGAGTSPAEDFEFVVTPAEGSPADGISIGKASFTASAATANGGSGAFIVSADATKFPRPGVYEYTLKEKNNATPGVTYDETEYTLKVTVLNADSSAEGYQPGDLKVETISLNKAGANNTTEKVTSIENTYSAGTLKISKTVDGSLGDKTAYFEFTITFTGGAEGAEYTVATDSADGVQSGNALTKVKSGDKIYLKHGETFIIENIPYGVEYTVVETPVDNYTTTKSNDSGKIEAAEVTAAFTNTYDSTPDTGITLDSLPYILIGMVVLAAAVAMILNKRRNNAF